MPAANVALQPLPLTPVIELWLIDGHIARHRLSHDEMLAVINYPAYWAFCWASGQVLAQLVLSQPEWVRGKRVLDFGSGSGVVAIAAAKAGAAKVIACDIDPDALAATAANAAHNQVELTLVEDFFDYQGPIDVIIAADVLYDRDNLPWLSVFNERAETVLVADSRVKHFDYPPYQQIAQRTATTLPDLNEFDEFNVVRIYHAKRVP